MSLVGKVPLPPGAVVRPVVADAGEVDPLGVTKLIAHEIEVALSTERHGDHADHLVEGNTAVDNQIGGGQEGHAVVHLLVHKPESDGLVADERLIVGLAITDNLLLVAPVCEGVNDVSHLPLVVRHLLEELDPHVGGSHGKAVVKAETTLRDGTAEGRHARHVLGDGEAPRADRVDKVVGKHQVNAGINVGGHAEVVIVTVHECVVHSVMLVQDRGDAVEAETVKLVLLDPPPQVGEEEAENLPRGVVVDARIPKRVVSLGTLVEVLVRGTVKVVDAVLDVLGSVRVNDIEEDGDACGERLHKQVSFCDVRAKTPSCSLCATVGWQRTRCIHPDASLLHCKVENIENFESVNNRVWRQRK